MKVASKGSKGTTDRTNSAKAVSQYRDFRVDVTPEELNLLKMYRELPRWEKNGMFLVMQSLAWGKLNPQITDKMTWNQIRRVIGIDLGPAVVGLGRDSSRLTEKDGHKLAVKMIHELRAHWIEIQKNCAPDQLEELWHQDDSRIVRGYLSRIREAANEALEDGFLAVLTDFLGDEQNGGSDLEDYYVRKGKRS